MWIENLGFNLILPNLPRPCDASFIELFAASRQRIFFPASVDKRWFFVLSIARFGSEFGSGQTLFPLQLFPTPELWVTYGPGAFPSSGKNYRLFSFGDGHRVPGLKLFTILLAFPSAG